MKSPRQIRSLTGGDDAALIDPRFVSSRVMKGICRAIGFFSALLSAKSATPVVRAHDFHQAVEKAKGARTQFRQAAESHVAKLRAAQF